MPPEPEDPGRRHHLVPTAVVGLVCLVVIAWFAIGDLSETPQTGLRPQDLDRMVGSPTIGRTTAWTLTVTSAVGAAWAFATVGAAIWSRRDRLRWALALAPLVALAVMVAGAARIVTAGTDGANIGGGLVLLLGAPAVTSLIILAAILAWPLLDAGQQELTGPIIGVLAVVSVIVPVALVAHGLLASTG